LSFVINLQFAIR